MLHLRSGSKGSSSWRVWHAFDVLFPVQCGQSQLPNAVLHIGSPTQLFTAEHDQARVRPRAVHRRHERHQALPIGHLRDVGQPRALGQVESPQPANGHAAILGAAVVRNAAGDEEEAVRRRHAEQLQACRGAVLWGGGDGVPRQRLAGRVPLQAPHAGAGEREGT